MSHSPQHSLVDSIQDVRVRPPPPVYTVRDDSPPAYSAPNAGPLIRDRDPVLRQTIGFPASGSAARDAADWGVIRGSSRRAAINPNPGSGDGDGDGQTVRFDDEVAEAAPTWQRSIYNLDNLRDPETGDRDVDTPAGESAHQIFATGHTPTVHRGLHRDRRRNKVVCCGVFGAVLLVVMAVILVVKYVGPLGEGGEFESAGGPGGAGV